MEGIVPKEISLEEAKDLGFQVGCKRMGNGEIRVRLMRGTERGSSGYIATVMPDDDCGWQNSHHHKGVQETYIVQSGWIGYAILMPDNSAKFFIYRAGQVFTTQVGEVHNVYMPCGAFIHTVKHGDCSQQHDWVGSEELDKLTQHVDEEELHFLASEQ
ncbi:hypothetical protein KTR10_00070 [Candidatus Kaiserbacteria bacterium]|nr:hypothetical protein [Candidatus Kaiserbacteria bacterium]